MTPLLVRKIPPQTSIQTLTHIFYHNFLNLNTKLVYSKFIFNLYCIEFKRELFYNHLNIIIKHIKYIYLMLTSWSNYSFETILWFWHICIEMDVYHVASDTYTTGCYIFAKFSHESRAIGSTVSYFNVFSFTTKEILLLETLFLINQNI